MDGAGSGVDFLLADDPDFPEVLRCVFGLQRHETAAYFALVEGPGMSARVVADRVDRDRSSVSRSLDALREKGLVERRREDLEAWTAEVHDRIEEFDAPE